MFIGFSLDAQKALIEEVHKRNLMTDTHSTSIEGLKLSILAGVDVIQHPEVLDPREMPDELVQMIKERKIIGSMLVNQTLGDAWKKHLKTKDANEKKEEAAAEEPAAGRSSQDTRRASAGSAGPRARRLTCAAATPRSWSRAGIIATPGTDNYIGTAPEFRREPKPIWTEPGMGTITAIEGMVELGMTPAQAIVAGTKNGAIAVPHGEGSRHAAGRQAGRSRCFSTLIRWPTSTTSASWRRS